jgi:chemotaxis protein MotB
MLRPLPAFNNLTKYIGISVLGLALTGCVPAEQYAGMKMKADQLAEQLGHSQTEISEANARADAAQRQLAALNNNGQTSQAMIANLTNQIADLQKQNDTWSQKYADAMAGYGKIQTAGAEALPAPLSNELKTFAEQNPDLIEFDAARGIVKFKSDVTFAVGDATVAPKAREVLSRFASILNSAGADGYELLVAGHTDNAPVTNPRTIKNGNPDNWYLSAHRAISVGKELIADGVSSSRMGVVGYADKRPIASNSTAEGKAQNRRVEVLILPTTVHTPSVATAEPRVRHSKSAGSAVPAAAKINKDDNSVTITK